MRRAARYRETHDVVMPPTRGNRNDEVKFAECIALMCGASDEEFLKAYCVGRYDK